MTSGGSSPIVPSSEQQEQEQEPSVFQWNISNQMTRCKVQNEYSHRSTSNEDVSNGLRIEFLEKTVAQTWSKFVVLATDSHELIMLMVFRELLLSEHRHRPHISYMLRVLNLALLPSCLICCFFAYVQNYTSYITWCSGISHSASKTKSCESPQ